MTDDIQELESLAVKMEQETQVYLGFRNAERAAAIRRVLAAGRRAAMIQHGQNRFVSAVRRGVNDTTQNIYTSINAAIKDLDKANRAIPPMPDAVTLVRTGEQTE